MTQKAIHPSISLDKSEGSVEVEGTLTLTATIVPVDAEVTWESDDTEVATVEDGVVTGVDEGSATITATITVEEQDYSATCDVTVSPKAIG